MTSAPDARSRPSLQRVPDPTPLFWATKAISTALGEAASDFSIHIMPPVVAVLCGFAAFVVSLVIQIGRRRYTPWAYWLTVAMVGVFGTMAADVAHVALGVPYPLSTALYALVLAAVFVLWRRTEGTLSVHEVTTTRRELFYWAAVVATFAMGTALGDFTAYGLGLGYAASVVLFAALILVPAAGYRFWRWNATFSFWFAYIVTRPLGASVADWLGKPAAGGGLDLGDGWVTLMFGAAMAVLVTVASLPFARRRNLT